MPDYTPTSVADMRAVFPERPEAINQEPTLLELLRILKYLMDCSQTHESSISDCNLLFLCIPLELYATHTNTAYSNKPLDPGIVPIDFGGNDAAARETVKAQFENAKQLFIECENMNKALTEEFLALISPLYTKEFKKTHTGNPTSLLEMCSSNSSHSKESQTRMTGRKTRTEWKRNGIPTMESSD